MTISDILREYEHLPFVSRDLIRFWIQKGWIPSAEEGARTRHSFTQIEIEKIRLLVAAYSAGFQPEVANTIAHQVAGLDTSSAAPRIVELIGTDRVQRLLATVSGLLEFSLTVGYQETLNKIAEYGAELFDSENCSVLEHTGGSGGDLLLVASAPAPVPEGQPILFPLPHQMASPATPNPTGLTGWLAARGEPARMNGDTLRAHPANRGTVPIHLGSRRCHSLMMVPIHRQETTPGEAATAEKRGEILGWVKVENKRSPAAAVNDQQFYDGTDIWLAERLCEFLAEFLRWARLAEMMRSVLEVTPKAESLPEVLNSILPSIVRALNGDAGEVYWVDEQRRSMILVAGSPTGTSEARLQLNDRLPAESLCHYVAEKRRAYYMRSVADRQAPYFQGRAATKCQAAAPIFASPAPSGADQQGHRVIGVISVEGMRHTEQLPANSEAILTYIAKLISPTAAAVGRRHLISASLSDHSPSSVNDAGENILEAVANALNFREGIIYVADPIYGILRVAASRPHRPEAADFVWRFDANSFASRVFRSGQVLRTTDDPWSDDTVDPSGLTLFNPTGPLIGVPLFFRQEKVGCMVLWSGPGGRIPTLQDDVAIQAYAQLAVSSLGGASIAQHNRILEEYLGKAEKLIDREAPSASTLEEAIQAILHGLAISFFDRARLFKPIVSGNEVVAFECIDSYGQQKPGQYKNSAPIHIKNPHAAEVLRRMKNGDTTAFERDPGVHGEDEDGKSLGKPPGAPWCLAGMIVNGQPAGYLAADWVKTLRRASPANLAALERAARLAAKARVLLSETRR